MLSSLQGIARHEKQSRFPWQACPARVHAAVAEDGDSWTATIGKPFDLQTGSIISYGGDMAELRRRLQDVIGMICRGPRDAVGGAHAEQHPPG